MKNDDRTVKTVISTVLTILPALIGTLALEMMPLEEEMMRAHMLTCVLLVPVIMAAVNLLCIWFTHRDRGNDDQSGRVMNMIYLLIPVLSLVFVGAMISFLMGFEDTDILIAFAISIMFIVIGNETPKFRRNTMPRNANAAPERE